MSLNQTGVLLAKRKGSLSLNRLKSVTATQSTNTIDYEPNENDWTETVVRR